MRLWVFGLALLALGSMAQAADAPRQITTSGLAERKVVPDEAHLNVTVSATNKSLETAKVEHDRKLKEVIGVAKRGGIDDAKIKTQHSNVQPQYTYDNGKQQFKGYQVQTALDITVRNLDNIGALMDRITAVKLDGDVSSEPGGQMSVYYTVAEPEKVRDEMLSDAIRNARLKAERMAAAAGARLGRVLQINEGNGPQFGSQPVPMMARANMMVMDKAGGGGAPVAPPPGEQQVNANVTVSFELKD